MWGNKIDRNKPKNGSHYINSIDTYHITSTETSILTRTVSGI